MDYDQTRATTYRCCGTLIIDARERRKVSSNTVRPLVPNLIRFQGEHYRGEKTDTKIQQLLLPSGSFELKRLSMQGGLSVCSAEVSEARSRQKCVENKRTQRFAVARRQGCKNILAA